MCLGFSSPPLPLRAQDGGFYLRELKSLGAAHWVAQWERWKTVGEIFSFGDIGWKKRIGNWSVAGGVGKRVFLCEEGGRRI